MGLLNPYVGKYASAKSASSEIDAQAIIAGCNSVDSEASELTSLSSKINSAGSLITKDALSFDGVGVDGSLNECCTGIDGVYSSITSTTSQIRSMAESVYNELQEKYNEEARQRDQALAQEAQKNQ